MSDSDSSEEPQECSLCREDAPIDTEAYETWLMCDGCESWYHGICVGISADECDRIDKYHCHKCVDSHGPSLYKGPALRRSSRTHINVDYTKLNDGQPATFNQYLLRLDAHTFDSDEFEHLENGDSVTVDWIRQRDTNDPFIIESSEGLGMQMPNKSIKISEIANQVGVDTKVSVMDVLTQEELPGWTIGQWADYFESTDRNRVLNVISLEISDTELGNKVKRPKVVDSMDLIGKCWPVEKRKPGKYPKVGIYCLMSVKDSYTDFHIDFSATWVYYHVLRGEKVFYLIPPTPSNIRRYEAWSKSPDQTVHFFAQNVRQCFEVKLYPGNTMFIPAGWIHAVYTPKDTLVIGGNFLLLQSLNTHIGAFKLETRTRVPDRFRFPYFLLTCKYTVKILYESWKLKEGENKDTWTLDELEGAFVLASFLVDTIDENLDTSAKSLGDVRKLRIYTIQLMAMIESALKQHMTSNEWVNRESQLREGCHFRWARPGAPRMSLLLASRPKRKIALGESENHALSQLAVKKNTKSKRAKVKLRLTRGTPSSVSIVNNCEIPNALGTGNPKTKSHHNNLSGEPSDENIQDQKSDASSSSGYESFTNEDASDGVDDFVATSDDDDERSRRKKHPKSSSRSNQNISHRSSSNGISKPKSAHQRIAERLKMRI